MSPPDGVHKPNGDVHCPARQALSGGDLAWLLRALCQQWTIEENLREAGFSEVQVSGGGSARSAEALWPGPDTTATIPSQVISVTENRVGMSDKASEAAGWVVRVTAQAMGGAQTEDFYLVAIPEKSVAEGVVRDKIQATADQSVEAVREISISAVIGRDLKPGEVRPA